jgi:hypothetical protein
VTPVDVLKLYLSTNMEDLSDTGKCTGIYTNQQTWKTSVTPVDVLKLYLSNILVSLGISMFVDKSNFSISTGVTEVFHVCK